MAIKLIFASFILMSFITPAKGGESNSSPSSAAKNSGVSNSLSNNAQDVPIITNEAEYAAWVKKREEAGRASSSARSNVLSSKATSSKNASSRPRKN